MIVLLLLLVLPLLKRYKYRDKPRRRIKVISKRSISQTARLERTIPDNTTPGFAALNELDTHADTCCAGANWALMEYTGQVCKVTPFLDSYQPVQEIPVA